jgi:2-aminoethylphosphonate-pyruvate transaminase
MAESRIPSNSRRLLFSPGPTNVTAAVRRASVTPDLSHRDPAFRDALARVTTELPDLLGGSGTHSAVLFASSATGAMESVISAIDGGVLVVVNGRYSERIAEIAERCSVATHRLVSPPFAPPDLEAMDTMLTLLPGLTHVAVVHHETTTGALLPLTAIGKIVDRHGLRLVVDGVSSVGAHDLDLRRDRVAFLTLNSNKCLEGLPGVSAVVARDSELEALEGRSRSFYFDLHAQWRRLQSRETPFTMPVQVVFAFAMALQLLRSEGYAQRVRRYERMRAYARDRLAQAGFDPVELPESIRGNVITTLRLPASLDFHSLHDRLQDDGITIYSNAATISSGHFFVATMGAITEADVDTFVLRLDLAAREQGVTQEGTLA